MAAPSPAPPDVVPRQMVCAVAAVPIGLGALALVGWATGNPALVGRFGALTPVQLQTAVALVLVGAALLVPAAPRHGQLVRAVVAVAVGLIAVVALAEWSGLLGTELSRWPRWLELAPGLANDRMAVNTAAAFLAAAVALAGTLGRGRSVPVLAGGLLIAVTAVASVVGYVLALEGFTGWGQALQMAVPTAFAFLAIATALLAEPAVGPRWRWGGEHLPLLVGAGSSSAALLVWRVVVEIVAELDDDPVARPAVLAATSSVVLVSVGTGLATWAWQRARRAQTDLALANRTLTALLREAPVGVVRLPQDGPPIANGEAVRLLAMADDPVERLDALRPVSSTQPDVAALRQTALRTPGVHNGRFVVPASAGRVVELRLVNLADPRGRSAQLLVLVIDVTADHDARLHLLAALRHEQQAVEGLERVGALKDAFLAAVSHELRTPLTLLVAGTQTLQARGPALTPRDQDELLAAMLRQASRLDRLLTDLLDLQRSDRGLLEPAHELLDVRAAVRAAAAEVELDDHQLVLDQRAGPVLALDPTMLARIVVNLVANAVRHTPAGGTVTVSVEQPAPTIVELVVADTGPGIAQADRQRVFEAFTQGPGPAAGVTGVGLGLHLVARFAELHGGRVEVEDAPGGGACFRVRLQAGG